MSKRRHGLKVNGPFRFSGLSALLLLRVIADDGVDNEAPVALKLRAQATEEFENLGVKGYASGNLRLSHMW